MIKKIIDGSNIVNVTFIGIMELNNTNNIRKKMFRPVISEPIQR